MTIHSIKSASFAVLGKLLLFGTSTAVCMIGAEAFLRLFPQYNDNIPVKIVNSKFSSYRMAPSQSATSLHGKNYNINSLGLRDKEIHPPYGEILALVAGDSSTMGYGVQVNERFSNVLSREIFKTSSSGSNISCSDCKSKRILNAGHSGYQATDNVGMIDYLLDLGIHPKILIIGVMNNDFSSPISVVAKDGVTVRANNPLLQRLEISGKSILRNSALYQFVGNSVKHIHRRSVTMQQTTKESEDLESIEATQLNAYISFLKRFSQTSDKTPIVFAYIPTASELKGDLIPPMSRLKKKAESYKCAAFVDPRQQLLNSGYKVKDLYALNDAVHPSAIGHKIIGFSILNEISNLSKSCSNDLM